MKKILGLTMLLGIACAACGGDVIDESTEVSQEEAGVEPVAPEVDFAVQTKSLSDNMNDWDSEVPGLTQKGIEGGDIRYVDAIVEAGILEVIVQTKGAMPMQLNDTVLGFGLEVSIDEPTVETISLVTKDTAGFELRTTEERAGIEFVVDGEIATIKMPLSNLPETNCRITLSVRTQTYTAEEGLIVDQANTMQLDVCHQ